MRNKNVIQIISKDKEGRDLSNEVKNEINFNNQQNNSNSNNSKRPKFDIDNK